MNYNFTPHLRNYVNFMLIITQANVYGLLQRFRVDNFSFIFKVLIKEGTFKDHLFILTVIFLTNPYSI